MDKDIKIAEGGCHCGSVRFRVALGEGLNNPVRCSCSLCRMRGAVMVFAPLGGIEILSGQECLASYRFNTNTAEHHFCSRCGIYTHHQRRFDPSLYAVNVACLDGVSPFDFEEVRVIDGVNHPRDHGKDAFDTAGVLRFEPTKD